MQLNLDFSKNVDNINWPPRKSYPYNYEGTKILDVVREDIYQSKSALVLTGFTSLSFLVDFFGTYDADKLENTRIILGFEPNFRGRRNYETNRPLELEIKEYWLQRRLSIVQGGAVIHLIDKIQKGKVQFRILDSLHAKIYIGDSTAMLGSANFSNNGLTKQFEANIRFERSKDPSHYQNISQIAENFYKLGFDYNTKIIDLLTKLVKSVTWQEAIARAVSEIIEGEWLSEYFQIHEKINKTKLWPTQKKGIARALSILKDNSNVLIADPTGSGKTKLCASLNLYLIHMLYEMGKEYTSSSLIICPPLVIDNWQKEFRKLNEVNKSQISMGLLSNSGRRNQRQINEDITLSKILIVDEAHNYLNRDSNRSKAISKSLADYKILSTATPISRKIGDILRLIELLDIDNLSDEEFQTYRELSEKRNKRFDIDQVEKFRGFIGKFTLRRTKSQLNNEINKEPEKYLNHLGNLCKFPEQECLTYKTSETENDKKLAQRISELASELKGLIYLKSFDNLDTFKLSPMENEQDIIQRRIKSAKALTIFMIRSSLRSSKIALIEHLIGTSRTCQLFDLKSSKNHSGNIIETVEKLSLPLANKKIRKLLPSFLTEIEEFNQTKLKEINLLQEILELAQSLSNEREKGKLQLLLDLSERHNQLIAFDSTVLTLAYLNKLNGENNKDGLRIILLTGSNGRKSQEGELINSFTLGSKETNLIGLFSDKMNEGVNLQQASCVVLLDMPSVIRVAEQRIGRVERMDSPHKNIQVYWPDDSEQFSLKGDSRLYQTTELTEMIYGSNLRLPMIPGRRYFTQLDSVQTVISEFQQAIESGSDDDLKDTFQPVSDLVHGRNKLIPETTYLKIKKVSTTIETGVSFIKLETPWAFFSIRATKTKAPYWVLIINPNRIETDYGIISDFFRGQFSKPQLQETEWNQERLEYYIKILTSNEKSLLSNKKRRALEVAEYILKRKINDKDGILNKRLYMELLKMLQPNATDKEPIDFDKLATIWIEILQPFLNKKRQESSRRKVYNLNSLKNDLKGISFDDTTLLNSFKQNIYTSRIDTKIAACIIASN